MRTKVLIALSLLTLVGVIGFQGCQSRNMSKQIRKVDSLMADVKEAENTMVIDISTIKGRYDTIQRMDSFINEHYDRELTDRFTSMMNQYSAIRSNYQNFIKNYELRKYENEKHRKRLKDLKKDLVEGNVTKEKFQNIYQEEQKIIEEHLRRTKNLVSSITKIERQYRRTQDKISQEYRRLKARQSP